MRLPSGASVASFCCLVSVLVSVSCQKPNFVILFADDVSFRHCVPHFIISSLQLNPLSVEYTILWSFCVLRVVIPRYFCPG